MHVPWEKVSVVNIEPTNACMLRCKSCVNDTNIRKPGLIPIDLFIHIASQCKGKEIRPFMSGEPLLHPYIHNLIFETRKHTNRINMHTNAVRLHPELGIKLIDAGLTHLSISFDGLNRDEYESNRVGANFDVVSKNIRDFIRINRGRVHLTIQRIIKMGQEPINLSGLFPGANIYPVIIRHSWDEKDKIDGHRPEHIYEKNCFFLWNYISVLWDGRVVACCADLNGKCIIGDAKVNTLQEIWNGEIMRSLRQRMLERKPIPEICSGCERYFIK